MNILQEQQTEVHLSLSLTFAKTGLSILRICLIRCLQAGLLIDFGERKDRGIDRTYLSMYVVCVEMCQDDGQQMVSVQ